MFRFLRAIPMRALSPLSLATAVVPLLLTLVEHAPAVIHALRALPGAIAQHVRHHAQRSHAHLHAQAKARYSRKHATAIGAAVAEKLSLSDHIALVISNVLGCMPTAVFFFALSLVSLPAVLASHDPVLIVAWISQACIQLVALPILGIATTIGNRQSQAHTEAMLEAQNRVMDEMLRQLAALRAQDRTHDAQIAALRDTQEADEPTGAPTHARKPRRPRLPHAVANTKE